MMKRHADFLTTNEDWNLPKLLVHCGSAPSVLVAIGVQPRYLLTGLLEETGHLIHKIWSVTLHKIPDVVGHRMMWSQLVFVCASSNVQAVEIQFIEVLQSCMNAELKSLCVLSAESGDADAKLIKIDRMIESISKARNFGNPKLFDHWLLDGEKFLV
jgi:hypothetical protein